MKQTAVEWLANRLPSIDFEDDPFGVVIILFSTIETVIVISLLCNMKPV